MPVRRILLFLLSLAVLTAGSTLEEALSQGSVQGNIKLFYYNIDRKSGPDAYATALGGHLQYTTQTWNELYARVSFHTSNPVGPNRNKIATGLFNNNQGGNALTTLHQTIFSVSAHNILKAETAVKTPLHRAETAEMILILLLCVPLLRQNTGRSDSTIRKISALAA